LNKIDITSIATYLNTVNRACYYKV